MTKTMKEEMIKTPARLLIELIGYAHQKATEQDLEAQRLTDINHRDFAQQCRRVRDESRVTAQEARQLLDLPRYPYDG